MDLGYEGRFTFVAPFATKEGAGFGAGDGTCFGPRITGKVRWANHPRRRSDGVMQVDAEGAISTDDGASILFTLRGRTVTLQKESGEKGGHLFHILLESGDERYAWVNHTMCVGEAVIDPGTLRLVVGIHQCVNEMLERLP
jgi:hypothetical protein